MANFVVHYIMRKGNSSFGGEEKVSCDTELVAVRIAEDKVKSRHPEGYTFELRKVVKK